MSGSLVKLDNGEYGMRVVVLQSPNADGAAHTVTITGYAI